ncbi:MAG: hypothetical protein RRB13_08710 [bacterium]|nr:hypothetical protein [bacterium]
MSTNRHKRWDVSKRFLKYSESILAPGPKTPEELIHAFLRALKEVLPPRDLRYYRGQVRYELDQKKLKHKKEKNPPEALETEAELLLCTESGGDIPHRLFFPPAKLTDNKLRYFELIQRVYGPELNKCLSQLEGEAHQQQRRQQAQHLQSKYRKQKEVIIAIERFARKQQSLGAGLLKDLREMPELEQEIINFQNQLLSELESSRAQALEERNRAAKMMLFFGKLIDELADKLRISLGLMDLFPLDLMRGPAEFRPGLLVLGRLEGLQVLCEALVENLDGLAHRAPLRYQSFNALELMHQSLSLFSKSEEARTCLFSFASNLGKLIGQGDPQLLSSALARFYGLIASLQEFEAKTGTLVFTAKGKNKEGFLEINFTVEGLELSEEGERLLYRPKDLFDTLEPGFLSPVLMHHLIAGAFVRHGGSMELVRRSGGRIEATILVGQPAQ